MSIDHATLAHGTKPRTNAPQRFLVETHPPTGLYANGKGINQNLLNTPSNKSSHTKAQEITFADKVADTGIHESLIL